MRKFGGIGKRIVPLAVGFWVLSAGPAAGEELIVGDPSGSSETRWGIPGGIGDGHPNFESDCGLLVKTKGQGDPLSSFERGNSESGNGGSNGSGPRPGKVFLLHLAIKFGISVPPCP